MRNRFLTFSSLLVLLLSLISQPVAASLLSDRLVSCGMTMEEAEHAHHGKRHESAEEKASKHDCCEQQNCSLQHCFSTAPALLSALSPESIGPASLLIPDSPAQFPPTHPQSLFRPPIRD